MVYHKDEGVRLLPYDWFLALERAESAELIASDANIRRYAFLSDSDDAKSNPDRLPIGFTKYDPLSAKATVDEEFACDSAQGASTIPLPQLGFTCAACHTGELHYRGKVLRVEGGPSMQNNLQFFKDVSDALKAMVSDKEKFGRFAGRVLQKPAHKGQTPVELGICVKKYLMKRLSESYNKTYPTYESLFPFPWGFGRLDAFGRGGNTAFGKLDRDNLQPATAPVSIPALWNVVWSYDRVQWNGAIHDLRARYIAQSVGLNAPVRLSGDPSRLFETGFDLKEVDELAKQYRKIIPPAWPSHIFDDDKTEGERATRVLLGKDLYAQRCAGCHVPTMWNADGLDTLHMITLSDIGTDPASLTHFINRVVKTGPLKGVLNADTVPAVKAIEFLTTGIMKQNGLDVSKNRLTSEMAYVARPHAGVWATAPFLHNGSIPNLYLLLSPQEERDAQAKTFCLGDLEFDPEQVGFTLKRPPCAPAESLFDTTLAGNRNTGHEFRSDDRAGNRFSQEQCKALLAHGEQGILGCELTHDDRLSIIEYLKTL
jgi:mono/diheme cytochrome c family protein